MKSITTYKTLNNLPYINITYEGLLAIKEIVKIAPQEAQWFHTVEAFTYKQSPNEIQLLLSDKLYIPTQNTSIAQVDTTATMMVDFYKELQEDYQDQNVVNQKLSAMTCWCHSHHNMSPNPSHQDDLQFNSFVSLAKDQEQKSWQIMLIFNKKDEFYSRIYDPYTESIHEGVPITVINSFDFSYIHRAAKTKFKQPARKTKLILGGKPTKSFSSTPTFRDVDDPIKWLDDENCNDEIAKTLLAETFTKLDPYQIGNKKNSQTILLTGFHVARLNHELSLIFDDQETLWFTYLLCGRGEKVLQSFTQKAFEKLNLDEEAIGIIMETMLTDSSHTVFEMHTVLIDTLTIADQTTKTACKEYLKNNGYIK